jgi:hypothetical protein
MRNALLTTATAIALAAAPAFAPAFGQTTPAAHEPGTGMSGPAATHAANTDDANTHSDVAPHFAQPGSGADATPESYLRDADAALSKHHTGEAQQALEMAETRMLDRSTPVGTANQPAQSQEVRQIGAARQALGHGDVAGAQAAIKMALESAVPTPAAN